MRPSPPPLMQVVITGDRVVGHLLRRGVAGVEALDRDDRSIGLFPTTDEGAQALGWRP
jgi:hypothetical protein